MKKKKKRNDEKCCMYHSKWCLSLREKKRQNYKRTCVL